MKGYSKLKPPKKSPGPRKQYLKASGAQGGEIYRRVLDAISLARRNPTLSLAEAARERGTTIQTVQRYASSAITYRNGDWRVKPHDTLQRTMTFLTDRGRIALTTHDSNDATLIGEYSNAIRQYLQPPHPTKQLKRFENSYIVADGKEYDFVTDPRSITRLARGGVIYFMDLYVDGRL